jgi:hypothetical protein
MRDEDGGDWPNASHKHGAVGERVSRWRRKPVLIAESSK